VDENLIAERLVIAGMGRTEAIRKGRWFTQTLANLDGCRDSASGGSFAGEPYLLFVPGRIEVLGKHTDYAGGRSLLAAVERGFSIAVRPRSDCRLRITDAASGEVTSFTHWARSSGLPKPEVQRKRAKIRRSTPWPDRLCLGKPPR
jgi:hypothetical protein